MILFIQEENFKSENLVHAVKDLSRDEIIIFLTQPKKLLEYKNEDVNTIFVDCFKITPYIKYIEEFLCNIFCSVAKITEDLIYIMREGLFIIVKPYDNLPKDMIKQWIIQSLFENIHTKNFENFPKSFLIKQAQNIEFLNGYNPTHALKVGEISYKIGIKMGINKEMCKNLMLAGIFHDIGKLFVPFGILHKPGMLNEKEFCIMKTHVTSGVKIFKAFFEMPDEINYAILCHHKNFDGTSYPEKCDGTLFGDIVKVADVFDAITSKRSYKDAYSLDEAIEFIKKNQGTMFNPEVVEIFLSQLPQLKKNKYSLSSLL